MSDPTAPADGRCTFILYSGALQRHQRSAWWIRDDERERLYVFYKTVSDSFSWLEIALSLLTVVSLPPGQVLAAVGSGDRADCAITGKGCTAWWGGLHSGHSCSNSVLLLQVLLKPDCSLWGPVHSGARLFILVRTRRDKISSCWALGFHGRLHGIGIDL